MKPTHLTLAIAAFFLLCVGNASAQIITTYVGNGLPGYSGDGGPALSAEINYPNAVRPDSQGNIYIGDTNNNVIRKVNTATGIITTFAGNGTGGYSGDGGPAASAELFWPIALAFDASGNLFVADYINCVIRKITPAGIISTVAGNGTPGYLGDGGPATSAEMDLPTGVTVDASENVYIADGDNDVVRKVDGSTGIITTFAGTGTAGYTGDGGPATLATFSDGIEGLGVDAQGNVYVSDGYNTVVRKVTVSTGIITTFAGSGTYGFSGNGGPATLADFNFPGAISFDCAGNAYITDEGFPNPAIWRVAPSGIITIVAGSGVQGYCGDGGPPTSACFEEPEDAALDGQGNLYVADAGNNLIRKATGVGPLCSTTPTPTGSMTSTPTATGTPTHTPSPTPTPTATSSPTFSNTSTATFTPTITWTPTISSTPTWTGTPTPSPTATNSPTITWTPTITSSPTPYVPKPYLVEIDVYNNAGELVTQLWAASTAQPIENLGLEPGNEITALTGPGSSVSVYGNGQLITSWNGLDSSGNPVSNGQYFVSVKNVSPLGAVTALIQPVIVDRVLTFLTLGIFNSAGEEVRHLYQRVQDATAFQMNGLSLNSAVFRPAGVSGELQITIQTSPVPVSVVWDGRGDNGLVVTPGIYEVEADWTDGNGPTEVVNRQVIVEAEAPQGQVVARPNVLNLLNGTDSTVFDATGIAGASRLEVSLYTIAGELVRKIDGTQGTAQVSWNSQGYASGLYVVVAVVYDANGRMLVRQSLQITVIH